MKFRCKLQGGTGGGVAKTVDLPDNANLSNLINAVASLYGSTPDAIQLSQNGRDPLSAAPESTAEDTSVRSLSLVPGDLLYVRCLSGTATAPVQQASVGSSALLTTTTTTATAGSASSAASSTSLSVAVPILVGEVPDKSTSQLCPSLQLLQRLYNSNRSSSNQLLRFALAVHCLMVETGFLSVDPATGRSHQDLLASGFEPDGPDSPASAANRVLTRFLLSTEFSHHSSSVERSSYAIEYGYCLTQTNEFELIAPRILLKVVRTGQLVLCHCAVWQSVANETGEQERRTLCCHSWHCTLDRFVTSADGNGRVSGNGFQSLRLLSSVFKDAIAERAKAAIHEACGLPLRGLIGLPTELVLRIMRNCHGPQAVCSLGQACRRLRLLHSDNYVWRAMLVRDYGSSSQRVAQYLDAERQGLEVNYYEAYRVFHEERVKRRRMLARLSSRELAPFGPAAPWHDMPGVLPPLVGLNLFPGPAPLMLLPPEVPELPLRPLQFLPPEDI